MVALTREDVPVAGAAGRMMAAELAPLVGEPDATYFVCGSAGFAETASMVLLTALACPRGRQVGVSVPAAD